MALRLCSPRPLLPAALAALCVAALCALAAAFPSCSDPADWYPRGRAELVACHETEAQEGALRTCVVYFRVTNTGRSKIGQSSISFSVETDQRLYCKTAVSQVAILPGSSAFFESPLVYASAAERIKASGARIVDQYYE